MRDGQADVVTADMVPNDDEVQDRVLQHDEEKVVQVVVVVQDVDEV